MSSQKSIADGENVAVIWFFYRSFEKKCMGIFLQGVFKYPPPSFYGFLTRLQKGGNYFLSP